MKSVHEGKYAVVTGASQGLGAAFAEVCARDGWNLILVSLPGEGLPELAETLRRRYGVFASEAELDLSRPENQEAFVRFAAAGGRKIGLLVNNAGIGANGLFDRIPGEFQRRTVDVNLQSTLAITYGLIPSLRESRPASILTVASLSAFYPMPLFAVYAASKSFLLHWSLALRQELAPLGIGVTALAPGGIYTSADIREKVRSQGFAGKLSSMEPEAVARQALEGLSRRVPVVIPGFFNRLLRYVGNLCPRNLAARLIFRRWARSLEKVREAEGSGWCVRGGDAA